MSEDRPGEPVAGARPGEAVRDDRPGEAVRAAPLVRVIGAAVRVSALIGAVGRRRPVTAVDRALSLVVASVTPEAEGVVSLRLVTPGGGDLPAWSPGAHLDLVLPSGRVRQYSLCGDPSERSVYRVAVRRLPDGAGGSVEAHALHPGDRVGVRGPRQAFPLLPARAYLFLAGGIGITPILPMARAVAATGADWRLVYTGRDRASMPFLAELPASGSLIRPDAEHGGPPAGVELLRHAPGPGTVGYCCGPPPMLAAVRAARPGSAVSVLHAERFAPPPVLGGRPLTVELSRSGTTLDVPSDRSVLDVLRSARPDVAYSCRQGFCGTCRVRVLAGEVEHRDRALTPAERADWMTVCVSRAVGDRLVLDR